MSDQLAFEVHSDLAHDAAIEGVMAALKEEGFGVLTRIDLHDAFQEKIGVEFRPYTILGACNPVLAHEALSQRSDIGLMLPCNVTVEANPNGGSTIRIMNPEVAMDVGGIGDDAAIQGVASEAGARLARVAQRLAP